MPSLDLSRLVDAGSGDGGGSSGGGGGGGSGGLDDGDGAPLPVGWKRVDATMGGTPLPAGWQRIDEGEGAARTSFFYNEASGVSQWDAPWNEGSEGLPGAPVAPSEVQLELAASPMSPAAAELERQKSWVLKTTAL